MIILSIFKFLIIRKTFSYKPYFVTRIRIMQIVKNEICTTPITIRVVEQICNLSRIGNPKHANCVILNMLTEVPNSTGALIRVEK